MGGFVRILHQASDFPARGGGPARRGALGMFPPYDALGSPVVPFTLFFGYGFPYKITNPKKGALIVIWLHRLHVPT